MFTTRKKKTKKKRYVKKIYILSVTFLLKQFQKSDVHCHNNKKKLQL